MGQTRIEGVVVDRREIASDVFGLVLEVAPDQFRGWTPGSHIDLLLPNGDCRQYSLTGWKQTPGRIELGILWEKEGRGGSDWIVNKAQPGSPIAVSPARNHFVYEEGTGRRKVFIAGGIGVTPLIPMIARARDEGCDWELHYIGRSRDRMAYIDELLDAGGTVVLHPRDEAPRPDVRRLLEGMGAADVYCCGPEGLMETVEEAGRSNPDLHVKVERFVPRPVGEERGFDGFEVVFEYSGLHASVDAGTSILSAAAAAGIDVPSSCEEGTCGTCETPVIEGEVVHLDSVLSDAERDASATMMICVSRANCPRLVLDL